MNKVFRSIKLIEENCKGCTKCMNKCPMEAIRLKNSKAVIYEDKCIDCGECIRNCPYNGYVTDKNTLDEIEEYKIKIAIPSVTLYSQFGESVDLCQVNEAIKGLGFDRVVDITYACDIATEITKKEIEKVEKPAIGIFCTSIEHLIKISYPNLLENVVRVLTPIEIAVGLIREEYSKRGYDYHDVGVFYLSPCVSWITLVKSQELTKKTDINGVIPISDVYGKLLKELKKESLREKTIYNMSYTGLSWAYPGGLSKSMNLKEYIAVDGVENVKKVFDNIESGKLKDVDFVEAYACSGGCLGGIFLVENPYNAKRITKKYYNQINDTYGVEEISNQYRLEFSGNIREIKGSDQKLADDFLSAVKKMKYMNELINLLPGTDCGLCGSPSCKAFAEDVVRGLATLDECTIHQNK